jgi:hypothetical protein
VQSVCLALDLAETMPCTTAPLVLMTTAPIPRPFRIWAMSAIDVSGRAVVTMLPFDFNIVATSMARSTMVYS